MSLLNFFHSDRAMPQTVPMLKNMFKYALNHVFKKTSLRQKDNHNQSIISFKYWRKKLTNRNSNSAIKTTDKNGQVYLIGGGCGDAELLTMKAYRMLQKADIIMVDWLVNPDIYEFFPKHAQVEFVGKKCGKHSMHQDDICNVMLAYAQAGNTVVRLKGGDPSIFGRLAEETDILQKHGIEFAVVPGITAATGCAAYSGIPLTHRDCAQSVRFITASLKDKGDEVKWKSIANEQDTLVFYMGLSKVSQISSRLIQYGMRSDLPIAIIDQGTLNKQQVVCATLATIEQEKLKYDLTGPAIIIVGEVVNKRQQVELNLLAHQNCSTELTAA
ncbi:uroporphyrinogen-III C-methyltransferase [Thalassotalea crassostreae]|uniref:uroporphyrinogen-III C-methyltransferase n=1 Tax=Thalassotalea crassostreae TaxID=1763536 RepID=UPI000839316C|nr:uroporphyrinogen-III C-methyltransferase [Thalassotalea crassostreae]